MLSKALPLAGRWLTLAAACGSLVAACSSDDPSPGNAVTTTAGVGGAGGAGPTTGVGGSAEGWVCDPGAYGSGDGCDCGCGVADPDCGNAGCTAASCFATTCDACYDEDGAAVDCYSLTDGPLDIVVDVPKSGPYGQHVFRVPAQTNWVNTGLYLAQGQTAEITAEGSWSVDGQAVGPEGDGGLGVERGCPVGSFVARSGLRFEDEIACIGAGGTFTAPRNDIVYVGMIASTDLGETYGTRLVHDGELEVTVASDGDTVPSVRLSSLESFPLGDVASGWVEILGHHTVITVSTAQAEVDARSSVASIGTLDTIYAIEETQRGMTPFDGQRVRWFPDDLSGFYMLAGNPVRVTPDIMNGPQNIRILRASIEETDIWGFSHELGHVFSFANGTWVFQYLNVESWPNLFSIDALEQLGRTEGQPNYDTYCDGKDDYLASGTYPTLRDDPFVQLCFLMQFTEQYGWAFWTTFWTEMNTTTNADVGYDGTDESVWGFLLGRFSSAAGEDVTPIFQTWKVPLP